MVEYKGLFGNPLRTSVSRFGRSPLGPLGVNGGAFGCSRSVSRSVRAVRTNALPPAQCSNLWSSETLTVSTFEKDLRPSFKPVNKYQRSQPVMQENFHHLPLCQHSDNNTTIIIKKDGEQPTYRPCNSGRWLLCTTMVWRRILRRSDSQGVSIRNAGLLFCTT
jgi:hypothetical protein